MMSCSQFRRFLCLSAAALLLTCVFAAGAAEPAALLGDWEGAIETPAGDMPVYLHVTKSKDGKFGGSIDSPDQGAMGLPVTALSVAESNVHFEVKTVNGIFDGKINADLTAMSGTWKGVMGDMPLKLRRPAKK